MERPILMSTPMVQAIMDGRKTQTRRAIKKQPHTPGEWIMQGINWLFPNVNPYVNIKCPYGKPGDILWVRETHYAYGHWTRVTTTGINSVKKEYHFKDLTISYDKKYHYEDNPPENIIKGRWGLGWYKRPSIFMPKEACRIKLLVKDIRVERLQDISEQDAIAEGIQTLCDPKISETGSGQKFYNEGDYPTDHYERLWESINGKESYKSNPWVWVITFEKILP